VPGDTAHAQAASSGHRRRVAQLPDVTHRRATTRRDPQLLHRPKEEKKKALDKELKKLDLETTGTDGEKKQRLVDLLGPE
jgi:hypothetical protein